MRSAIFAVVLLFATPAVAQTVTDGDTIKLDGVAWRLWGIDAPETKQMCGGQAVGRMAAGALAQLVKSKTIACEFRVRDRYGRSVGLCRADGGDLGAAMVEIGMAWAFVRYSRDYVHLEEKARAENLGVHAFNKCQPPWEWRAERR